MDAQRSAIKRSRAPTSSGTRTLSSISCMSSRSSTPTTTASATFPGLISKLDYIADLGVNAIWLLPFYPSPLLGRRLRHQRLPRRSSRLRHAGRLSPVRARGACARHPRHHRTRHQPYLRPASVVPARAPGEAGLAVARISTSGRTPTRNMPARASSFSTPSARTGPGTRSPAPTTGTASIRISRI